MERGSESVLNAIFHGLGLAGDERDVEMLDAEPPEAGAGGSPASSPGGGPPPSEGGPGGSAPGPSGRSGSRRKRRNKRRKKGRGSGGVAPSTASLNKFVIETCKHLRENKSYLLWNAIGCLGFSAVRDLVKEVDAIQRCGGQRTTDGRRFRTGGGILWNILKTREPKAYNEIMATGKTIEKQFKVAKPMRRSSNKDILRSCIAPDEAPEGLDHPESGSNTVQHLQSSDPKTQCKELVDSMRIPVSYGDPLEGGEIQ